MSTGPAGPQAVKGRFSGWLGGVFLGVVAGGWGAIEYSTRQRQEEDRIAELRAVQIVLGKEQGTVSPLFWSRRSSLSSEQLRELELDCFVLAERACLEHRWGKLEQISDEVLSKLRSPFGNSLLIVAAKTDDPEAVEWLFERHIAQDINGKGENTPLHIAAANGCARVIPILSFYYDECTNSDGMTARDVAIARGHTECAVLLEPKERHADGKLGTEGALNAS